MKPFPCFRCGTCCRHVDAAQETKFLDSGDGSCRHFNSINKSCSIYEDRPDICRVDLQYRLNYHKKYSWEEFIAINLQACEQLQNSFSDKEQELQVYAEILDVSQRALKE